LKDILVNFLGDDDFFGDCFFGDSFLGDFLGDFFGDSLKETTFFLIY
jgi:hypothetical protein